MDRTKISRLEGLRKLAGYVENGTETTITIGQDDATRDWLVKVGNRLYHGPSFYEALDSAIEDLKEDD